MGSIPQRHVQVLDLKFKIQNRRDFTGVGCEGSERILSPRRTCPSGRNSKLELIALVERQLDFFLEGADARADRLLDILLVAALFE